MPKKPSWIDKVNFVTDFWADPCSTPAWVYAKTALPALGNVVLVLLDIGLDDMLRSTFRPRGLRQKRHGRKGTKRKPLIPSLPEPSDVVARRIPGHRALRARWTDGFTQFLWKVDGVGQKWLHRYMVVNLVTDFFYDWGTGIMEHPQSDCSNRSGAAAERDGMGVFLGVTGWTAINYDRVLYERHGVGISRSVITLPAKSFLITYSAEVSKALEFQEDVKAGLRLIALGGGVIQSMQLVDVPETGRTRIMQTATVRGPGIVAVQYISFNGNTFVWDGDLAVIQMTGSHDD